MNKQPAATIRVEIRQAVLTSELYLDTFVIGRGRCDLRIDGAGLAPEHARVRVRDDDIEITPLAGAVRIADRGIAGPARVARDVPITLGDAVLRIRAHATWRFPEAVHHGLDVPGPRATSPGTWRTLLAEDVDEHDLLAHLRETPNDPGARMVYADWLEGHGHLVRAELARTEGWHDRYTLVRDSTPEWRALVAAAPISSCFRTDCPGWWHELYATDDERHRTCARCTRRVRYVVPADPPAERIRDDTPIVLDVALAAQIMDVEQFAELLQRVAPWRLERDGEREGREEWTVWLEDPPDQFDQIFGVRFDGRIVGILYGGSDAGIQVTPSYRIAELDIRGLALETIGVWLRHAFTTLPARTVGLT